MDQGLPTVVLFDMDGTLIDTEPWWFQGESCYCQQYGVEWTRADAAEVIGGSLVFTSQKLVDKTGSSDTAEQAAEWLLAFMENKALVNEPPWMPGILELIERLRDQGVKVGLVTSSHRQLVDPVLRSVGDDFFDVVVTGDDVANLKPHPEPYQTAMKSLDAKPEQTVILEDSESGLASAHASGARVVAVPCVVEIPANPGRSRVSDAGRLSNEILRRIVAGETVYLLD